MDYTSANFFQNAYNYYSSFARACNAEWGGSGTVSKIGRLISTTQTARDIKAIADKVGDKQLRYWGKLKDKQVSLDTDYPGFSYGTVLGATIAKLFPSNIKGMIIDGNINPNGETCSHPLLIRS